MAGIDGERREHRKNLGLEKRLHPLQLGRSQVVHPDDLDSVLLQLRQQHVVQALPLLLHQVGDALRDRVELLAGSQAVGRNVLHAGGDLPPESGDPDHVELVEIRAEDREEFDALEQPVSRVERLVENPGVEREPAQLTIDV